ncbi:hypothetical protein RB195_025484 [Necator americanus]|uniref:Uncharacterized protein n=1 Tax=Necator americanus TaxID=51031 RepID=A0ABR1ESI1_NECAM
MVVSTKQTSDNGNGLIDLCEQTKLIIASTFKKNHRCHQLTRQRTTPPTPKKQRKRKMPGFSSTTFRRRTYLCHIRKYRAVWDDAFDFDHHPVLSFIIRFQKRSTEARLSISK